MSPSTIDSTHTDMGKGGGTVDVEALDESYVIDNAAEARLVRKLDLRLLPLLALAYLLTYIDRSNAGNARVAGLTTDLGFKEYDFNIGTCLYYVTFILSEIPAAIIVRRYGFIWIPVSIIAFGALTLGTAFIHNRGSFFAVRSLLGVAESLVFPGNAYMLTRYYRREELTVRLTFFIFTAGYLSAAFGGLLASAFLSIGTIGPLERWRHLFAWEGCITIVLGFIMIFIYPDDVTRTKMFSPEERKMAMARMTAGQVSKSENAHEEKITWAVARKTVLNPIVLLSSFFYICNNVTVQGLNTFIPTILRLLYPGRSAVQIQLLSVPPSIVAWVVAMTAAYFSMKTKQHGIAAGFGAFLTVVGYAGWLATSSSDVKARYAFIFINASGGFYGPLVLAWALSNASTDSARALSGATVSGLGGIGSIVASWSYVPSDAKTGYRAGNSLNVSLGAVVVLGIIGLRTYQARENKKRAAGIRDYRLECSAEAQEQLGNKHPKFRFYL